MNIEKSAKNKKTSKYLSKSQAIELTEKDYLTVGEIDERVIKKIRPDMLYRTHVAIHKEANNHPRSKKIVKLHKIVVDEFLSRGLLHHSWDKLDNIY